MELKIIRDAQKEVDERINELMEEKKRIDSEILKLLTWTPGKRLPTRSNETHDKKQP